MLNDRSLELLSSFKEGKVFILSAPAGTGKTTLVEMLTSEFPSVIESISYTTREPRPYEVEGQHYNFISEQEFKKKIQEDEFLEHVNLFGHYYGTSKTWLKKQLEAGKHVILTIDTQGAMALKKFYPAIFIFLSPPSLTVLQQRLEKRKTENKEVILERLNWAKQEMLLIDNYDYHVLNDDLYTAFQVLKSILIAETHRTSPGVME